MKKYEFVKIERPKFQETKEQIWLDIKNIDKEIEIEEKRNIKYRGDIIKELKKINKNEINVTPKKITIWDKLKFLFTGKW